MGVNWMGEMCLFSDPELKNRLRHMVREAMVFADFKLVLPKPAHKMTHLGAMEGVLGKPPPASLKSHLKRTGAADVDMLEREPANVEEELELLRMRAKGLAD